MEVIAKSAADLVCSPPKLAMCSQAGSCQVICWEMLTPGAFCFCYCPAGAHAREARMSLRRNCQQHISGRCRLIEQQLCSRADNTLCSLTRSPLSLRQGSCFLASLRSSLSNRARTAEACQPVCAPCVAMSVAWKYR